MPNFQKKIILVLFSLCIGCFSPNHTQAADLSEAAFTIDRISYFEEGQELSIVQADYLKVFKKNSDVSLDITIDGRLFAESPEEYELQAVVIPGNALTSTRTSTTNPSAFRIELSSNDLAWNEIHQLIIFLQKDGESTPVRESITSFQILSEAQNLGRGQLWWEATSQDPVIIFLSLLTLLSFLTLLKYRPKLLILLILVEIGALTYQSSAVTLRSYFAHGLLEVPSATLTWQTKETPQAAGKTLTKLDENLELSASLSRSWSNIDPTIWEFRLRSGDMTASDVISEVSQKITNNTAEKQYLASVKKMVSIGQDRLQFITAFPDPLLPQKLSRVSLSADFSKNENRTELYLPLETSPEERRLKRNPEYFGLPFLSSTPVFRTERVEANLDRLKEQIRQQELDHLDEPEPVLWPLLSQNGYKILPKRNTNSLFVLINEQNPSLADQNLRSALRGLLKSPRILQTSYFQYGQLASQFAPPGVVGYDPELQVSTEQNDPALLAGLTLTLHYPSQESKVAQVIQQILEQAGMTIQLHEIPTADFQPIIFPELNDLVLVSLDFELGDIGPFLDALIDSHSVLNTSYKNEKADELIAQARSELRSFQRLELLQEIMSIIVNEDPAGIPLLFKRSFVAVKKPQPVSLYDRWLQKVVLGWE